MERTKPQPPRMDGHGTSPQQISAHCEAVGVVVSALGSDIARGLSETEAQRRLEQYGPNQLKSAPETPWWARLLEQFQNFLVIILLVAIVISVIEWLLQDPRETALPYEAIVITAIVVLNALLGFVQEARAEKSVRALMALAAPEADGGSRRRAPARSQPTRSCPATSCWSKPATRSRRTPASSRSQICRPTRRR